MKVVLQPYNPDWVITFQQLKAELGRYLSELNPVIEHIGSTAVPGLSAKPFIDILIGVRQAADLDKTVQPLTDASYIYYQKYNHEMPYRRFFVKLQAIPDDQKPISIINECDLIPDYVNEHRLANIHIVELNTHHWVRHIAFRDYLIQHPQVKNEYQQLKTHLSTLEWMDFNDYNSGKDAFIKQTEQEAMEWLRATKR